MRMARVWKRRAFTLVELLVVVGIIAVLIAILLPVLGKAKEHANRIKCAANLRSMGQALVMYTQNYRYYPAGECWTNDQIPSHAAVWPPRLRPFLGGSKEVFLCPSQDEQCRWGDSGPQPLAQATGGSFAAFGYEVGDSLIHSRAYFSYGYNGAGAAGDIGSTRDGTHKGLGANFRDHLPASRVKVPADMIAITDSDPHGGDDYFVSPRATTVLPGRVHGGGANALFCDGHVTWYLQKDLLVDVLDLSQAHKFRMWNNDHRAPTDR